MQSDPAVASAVFVALKIVSLGVQSVSAILDAVCRLLVIVRGRRGNNSYTTIQRRFDNFV